MNSTDANPLATSIAEPTLSTGEIQTWIVRRERFRARIRFVLTMVAVMAVGTAAIVWTFFHEQLLAMGSLGSSGFHVEWDFNFENMRQGGVTSAVYQPRNRWQAPDLKVEDLKPLKSLLHLKVLDISMAQLRDEDFALLADLKELTELSLSRTSPGFSRDVPLAPLTDHVLDHVKNLTELKSLSLSEVRITDGGLSKLANLAKLETLDLDGTLITDNGLAALQGFKNLKLLRVENTKVTREGVAAFQKAMPNVEVSHEPISLDQYR